MDGTEKLICVSLPNEEELFYAIFDVIGDEVLGLDQKRKCGKIGINRVTQSFEVYTPELPTMKSLDK